MISYIKYKEKHIIIKTQGGTPIEVWVQIGSVLSIEILNLFFV